VVEESTPADAYRLAGALVQVVEVSSPGLFARQLAELPTGMVATTLLLAGSMRKSCPSLPVTQTPPLPNVTPVGLLATLILATTLPGEGALVADAVGDSDAAESSFEEQPPAEMASAMQATKANWYRSRIRAERWRTSSGR
jgi:hypothetical protein